MAFIKGWTDFSRTTEVIGELIALTTEQEETLHNLGKEGFNLYRANKLYDEPALELCRKVKASLDQIGRSEKDLKNTIEEAIGPASSEDLKTRAQRYTAQFFLRNKVEGHKKTLREDYDELGRRILWMGTHDPRSLTSRLVRLANLHEKLKRDIDWRWEELQDRTRNEKKGPRFILVMNLVLVNFFKFANNEWFRHYMAQFEKFQEKIGRRIHREIEVDLLKADDDGPGPSASRSGPSPSPTYSGPSPSPTHSGPSPERRTPARQEEPRTSAPPESHPSMRSQTPPLSQSNPSTTSSRPTAERLPPASERLAPEPPAVTRPVPPMPRPEPPAASRPVPPMPRPEPPAASRPVPPMPRPEPSAASRPVPPMPRPEPSATSRPVPPMPSRPIIPPPRVEPPEAPRPEPPAASRPIPPVTPRPITQPPRIEPGLPRIERTDAGAGRPTPESRPGSTPAPGRPELLRPSASRSEGLSGGASRGLPLGRDTSGSLPLRPQDPGDDRPSRDVPPPPPLPRPLRQTTLRLPGAEPPQEGSGGRGSGGRA